MTANELADKLIKNLTHEYDIVDECMIKAATMLRQQQAEIEALKLRELTNEEIMEIYDREELYNIDEGQMYLKPIEFAKELLKKASEK